MAFTVKQYCEEYGLDESRVFNMVLGESGSILPKARGYTGYIVEINDDYLDCTNDKFNVFHKQIPFSSFERPSLALEAEIFGFNVLSTANPSCSAPQERIGNHLPENYFLKK